MEQTDKGLEKTNFTISMTVRHKRMLKAYAAFHDMTVASVVQQWIEEHCTEMIGSFDKAKGGN